MAAAGTTAPIGVEGGPTGETVFTAASLRAAWRGEWRTSVRLDVTRHLEDRHIHRHHHAADHAAEEHHHERLDEAGHRGHRDVHLLLVEVGDLAQHGVERTGLLAAGDHLHDHGRHEAGVHERRREILALRYLRARVEDA